MIAVIGLSSVSRIRHPRSPGGTGGGSSDPEDEDEYYSDEEGTHKPPPIVDFDMDRLDGKDLTLEEILSLETDQDFWRIFQKPGEEERKPVPIYNVNRCGLD